MHFKIVVKNISDRIENVARQEAHRNGNLLKPFGFLGSRKLFQFTCQSHEDLKGLIDTLETDSKVHVVHVEDESGHYVKFRDLPIWGHAKPSMA